MNCISLFLIDFIITWSLELRVCCEHTDRIIDGLLQIKRVGYWCLNPGNFTYAKHYSNLRY